MNRRPYVIYTRHISKRGTSDYREKELARKTEKEAGAEAGTVNLFVSRLPDCYKDPINSAVGKVYNHFYAYPRVGKDSFYIPIDQLPVFRAKLNELCAEFYSAVERLIVAIETGELYEILKNQNGGLYDESKIPSAEAIRRNMKVDYRVSLDPKTDEASVRDALTALGEMERAEIEERIRVDAEKKEADERNNLLSFCAEAIEGFLKDAIDRCTRNTDGRVMWKTLVDKFEYVVKILPSFNITNDPKVRDTIESIYKAFNTLTKDSLAEDAEARTKVANTAQEILAEFKGHKSVSDTSTGVTDLTGIFGG